MLAGRCDVRDHAEEKTVERGLTKAEAEKRWGTVAAITSHGSAIGGSTTVTLIAHLQGVAAAATVRYVMPFDLVIAVKRDRGEGPTPEPVTARAKTIVFEANGALTHDGVAALADAVDKAISSQFRDYIVRFGTITEVQNDALLVFVQWVRGRRDEGVDIRLCALEPHIHHCLESLGEFADALMPLDQAGNDTARRILDVRHTPTAPTNDPP